jgi:hypothetical protein
MKLSVDSKEHIKCKLKSYLLDQIDELDKIHLVTKKKSGRPNSIPNDLCLDAIFYVLLEGVTWEIASKLATNTTSFRSTIHRTYQKWIQRNIFNETYDDLIRLYREITYDDSIYYIDSTDIQNKRMSKNETYKSFKLKKQALRLTLICDCNKIPIDHVVDPAHQTDNVLGYEFLKKTTLNKKITICGDKGYIMKQYKLDDLKRSQIKMVVPKKTYKKKTYKTKNYKRKRKIIRHTNTTKNILNKRIIVEHCNSIIHRSYKQISKINDTKINNFKTMLKIAVSMMIINKIT